MTSEHPDALALFRKWFEESTPLHCTVTFKSLGVGMHCTIASVSDADVTATSDDRLSTVRVILGRVMAFEYDDTRVVPGESEDFKGALVMFFGPPDDSDSDLITFIERREN
jgi:hypothetical protein